MKEALQKLREIGHKEINQRTHIASNRILYILNKDYGAFDKTTVTGFIRILEREYEVDLSEWLREFEQYLIAQEQGGLPDAKSDILEGDSMQNLTSQKLPRQVWSWRFLMLLLLFVIGFAGYYIYQQHFQSFDHILPAKTGVTPVLSSATESLEVARALQNGAEEKSEALRDVDTDSPKESESAKSQKQEEEARNPQEKTPIEQANVNDIAVKIPMPKDGANISFQIEHRMWVGVIYLDKRERITDTVLGEYKIDTSRNQLILTGHGVFDLEIDGKIQRYNSGSPVRFQYDVEKGLTAITLDEFMAKNGGREW